MTDRPADLPDVVTFVRAVGRLAEAFGHLGSFRHLGSMLLGAADSAPIDLNPTWSLPSVTQEDDQHGP